MAAREDEERARDDAPEPDAPGDPPQVLSYDSGRPARLKTLKRLPAFEANLAAAKLEAAGIPAFVDDQNMSAAHPVLLGQVRLQVDESNLDRAREALDARPPESAEGDYVEEEYRCPKCYRKAVDLLPVTGRMRSTRLGCVGVLLVPVVMAASAKLVDLDDVTAMVPPALVAVWFLALAVLAFIVVPAKRRKRCRECGHEW